jgi:copper oxidase (laccase) domain-containing protein
VRIDLGAINRAQLIEAGLPENQIHSAHLCTFCAPLEFHSYRRDKDQAGRMISAIGISER